MATESHIHGKPMGTSAISSGKVAGSNLVNRDVPTREWNTAAAQYVVEAAGRGIWDLNGHRLIYNKVDLTNPFSITLGDRNFQWE